MRKRIKPFHWSELTPINERFRKFRAAMGETKTPLDVLSTTTPELQQAFQDYRIAKDRFMALMAEEAMRAIARENENGLVHREAGDSAPEDRDDAGVPGVALSA